MVWLRYRVVRETCRVLGWQAGTLWIWEDAGEETGTSTGWKPLARRMRTAGELPQTLCLERGIKPARHSAISPQSKAVSMRPMKRNCSPHIIRQTINVSSIGRRLDTKLHEQMKICVNSMLCLMARPQIHLPNVKTCLDVVNSYDEAGAAGPADYYSQNHKFVHLLTTGFQ